MALDHVVGIVVGVGVHLTVLSCPNQLSMVKNIYLDTKIYLLSCQGADLHLEVALDHAVGISIFSSLSHLVAGSNKLFFH